MEINKQLFEDVLSGKLKGTFVLRNKLHIEAKSLMRSNFKLLGFLYKLHDLDAIHAEYTEYGKASDCAGSDFDIIDFIPETNMKEEKRNVTLTLKKAKEWYKKGGELKEVALQAFTEKELKDTKPRSWEEYCKKSKGKSLYYINENGIEAEIGIDYAFRELDPSVKNTIPSKELAEAFLAVMQLMSLRQDWIHKWSLERGLTKDWEPDWENPYAKYCIYPEAFYLKVHYNITCARPLSFPTEEMAEDFMNCFKDLLEVAKPLI